MKFARAWQSGEPRTFFRHSADGKHYWLPDEFSGGFEPHLAGDRLKLDQALSREPTLIQVPRNVVLAPPITVTGVACVGLNYKGHADECGADWTKFVAPTIFGRSLESVTSPNGDVVVPVPYSFGGKALGDGDTKYDYEVELAVVIGKPCFQVTPGEALAYVAGYALANDLSERTRQLQNGSAQWHAGKCMPTSFPIGPYFVPADEVGDPQTLRLQCWVNDELRQDDSTSEMIFSVAECISALSQMMILPSGFVISTGTPKGVITKAKPELIKYPWLAPGDVVRLKIANDKVDLGTMTNRCVAQDEGWIQFFRSGQNFRGDKFNSSAIL